MVSTSARLHVTSPVAESRSRAWYAVAEDAWQLKDDEIFDEGWNAALAFTLPLMEAAIRTWIVMEGKDIAGDGSMLSLRAARRVMREVPHEPQANLKGGCYLCDRTH